MLLFDAFVWNKLDWFIDWLIYSMNFTLHLRQRSADKWTKSDILCYQRPYPCGTPGCDKRYTDPSSLRKHQKCHSPASNFCDVRSSAYSHYIRSLTLTDNFDVTTLWLRTVLLQRFRTGVILISRPKMMITMMMMMMMKIIIIIIIIISPFRLGRRLFLLTWERIVSVSECLLRFSWLIGLELGFRVRIMVGVGIGDGDGLGGADLHLERVHTAHAF